MDINQEIQIFGDRAAISIRLRVPDTGLLCS